MNKNFIIIIGIILLAAGGYFAYTKMNSSSSAVTYQTTTAAKGSVVSTISASGSIAGGNNTTIYTSASGLVTKVFVKNGDTVKQGQKLATIQLDQDGQQKQASAWASYLNTVLSEKNAEQNKLALTASVDSSNQSVMNAQNSVNAMNDNINNGTGNPSTHQSYKDLEKNSITSSLTIAQENYTIAQDKLANADQSISAAKSQVSAAWYAYQQSSNTITAPSSGTLTSFTLTPGISVANLNNTSTTNSSNAVQSVGIIVNPNNQVTASVNLTEIDVVKARPGLKATITMDAFPGKTFTGQILAINTNGSVTSGVTNYPTIIVFDSGLANMYPNMSVTANIIIDSRDDVVTVPTSAIKTNAVTGVSTVQILKNNQPSTVAVTTGLTDGTNTEITSGVSENDVVITSTTSKTTTAKSSTTTSGSVFGGSGVRVGGGFRGN